MFVDISYYSEMNKNFMIMNQKEMSSDEAISKNLERNNTMWHNYLAHIIEQPNFRIPNPQYLQRNFRFDFFNDSENTFSGFFEI